MVDRSSSDDTNSGHPFARSSATLLLSEASASNPSLSQREIAKRLGKSAVVVSHLISGRAPIPIELAPALAEILGIDQGEFVSAVLEQRHPAAHHIMVAAFRAVSVAPVGDERLLADLEKIAGSKLSDLPRRKLEIVREVLSDRDPDRRWLTLNELPFVEELREEVADFRSCGLSPSARAAILRVASKRL